MAPGLRLLQTRQANPKLSDNADNFFNETCSVESK